MSEKRPPRPLKMVAIGPVPTFLSPVPQRAFAHEPEVMIANLVAELARDFMGQPDTSDAREGLRQRVRSFEDQCALLGILDLIRELPRDKRTLTITNREGRRIDDFEIEIGAHRS